MKLTKQRAVDICGVLRSGEPQGIIAQARDGESLDELIPKLARNRAAVALRIGFAVRNATLRDLPLLDFGGDACEALAYPFDAR